MTSPPSDPAPRVLVIGLNYAPEPAGNAPYTSGLVRGLHARGYQVDVLTGIPHYPQGRTTPEYTRHRTMQDTVDGVPIRRLRHHVPDPTSPMARIRLEADFGARALTTAWPSPDVVLCVSPALLATAMCMVRNRFSSGWSRRSRPAIGVWVQDLYSRGVVETGAMTGPAAKAAARFEAGVLRAADGVVAIHNRFKTYMVESLGVDAEKVTVIRNWTHLAPPPTIDRAAVRTQLGWSSDELIVLHAGNMGAKQGLDNVIAAARHADGHAAPIRFVLLGDGNQRARLMELGAGCQRLQFLAPLADEQYRAAMAAADVLLVNEKPGVTDMSLPSKLTSYFTTGRPVLAATDAASITAEEISACGGGLVVPADDPAQLVAHAMELGSNPDRAQQMGSAGRAFCTEKLADGYAVDQFDRWLRRLASRSQSHDSRPSVSTGTQS